MSRISHFCSIALLLAAAVTVLALPGYADSQSQSGCSNCNGYSFQANLIPTGLNTFKLSYTITNVSGTANPYSWSITQFGPANTISSVSNLKVSDGSQGAYTLWGGKSNTGNNCNGAVGGAICIDHAGSGSLAKLAQGQSLTFTMDVTCSNCWELAEWIFLSGNCLSNDKSHCYEISNGGYGGTTGVPEPSSWALYAATLAMLSFAYWKFGRPRSGATPRRLAYSTVQ